MFKFSDKLIAMSDIQVQVKLKNLVNYINQKMVTDIHCENTSDEYCGISLNIQVQTLHMEFGLEWRYIREFGLESLEQLELIANELYKYCNEGEM